MTVRYRCHDDLRMTELEDEGVVLHLGSRRYFTVSETGVAILEALKEQSSMAELVEHLLQHYDVSHKQASESVRKFIERCTEAKLVVAADAE